MQFSLWSADSLSLKTAQQAVVAISTDVKLRFSLLMARVVPKKCLDRIYTGDVLDVCLLLMRAWHTSIAQPGHAVYLDRSSN